MNKKLKDRFYKQLFKKKEHLIDQDNSWIDRKKSNKEHKLI
jgi:hypothetical protein